MGGGIWHWVKSPVGEASWSHVSLCSICLSFHFFDVDPPLPATSHIIYLKVLCTWWNFASIWFLLLDFRKCRYPESCTGLWIRYYTNRNFGRTWIPYFLLSLLHTHLDGYYQRTQSRPSVSRAEGKLKPLNIAGGCQMVQLQWNQKWNLNYSIVNQVHF